MTTVQSNYSIPVIVKNLNFFHHQDVFHLESGESLNQLTVAYNTFGELNSNKDNVIWVCHALTAHSDVSDWWEGLFGKGKIFDPKKYFIVCANILGSCYGSTCARSISPKTGQAYGVDFPNITMRDIVNAHELLRQHLGIESIDLCIGGSCGGHQVMEFAYLLKDKIKNIALLVSSARETAWAIAIHEAQRLAIQADQTWQDNDDFAGKAGLKAARGMALLNYRTFESYLDRQTDIDEKTDNFRASSYIQYQGKKLQERFYAQSYFSLTKALDSHNIGRGRGGIKNALSSISARALVLSIDSDLLIPPSEQHVLAEHLVDSTFISLSSPFGHDGFLVESETINELILDWMEKI